MWFLGKSNWEGVETFSFNEYCVITQVLAGYSGTETVGFRIGNYSKPRVLKSEIATAISGVRLPHGST